MPCRIALIEDASGQGWLVMMDVNVDAIAKEKRVPQALKDRINAVRKSLLEIMQAAPRANCKFALLKAARTVSALYRTRIELCKRASRQARGGFGVRA